MAGGAPSSSGLRRVPQRGATWLRRRTRAGLSEGWARVGVAAGPIALAAVVAGLAFLIAQSVLGQPYPFFAPAAAWISLGFTRDRSVRRVAEMAIGVSLGVALGEVLGTVLGVGGWQVALALAVAATLARLLDKGPVMTTQAGLQAIIVVALPASITGGSFGRWTDALLGGSLALVAAVLVPGRSWRRGHLLAAQSMKEIAGMLAMLASALRRGEVTRAADALAHGRAAQPLLDSWRAVATSGQEAARFSPVARRHRTEIEVLARAGALADHVMRNARVVTRRSLVAIENHGPDPALGDLVGRLALLTGEVGDHLRTGTSMAGIQVVLRALSVDLQPERFTGWRTQSLVVLLRSLLVDLLQVTGMTYEEAKAALSG